jgi:hypothetical protein
VVSLTSDTPLQPSFCEIALRCASMVCTEIPKRGRPPFIIAARFKLEQLDRWAKDPDRLMKRHGDSEARAQPELAK